MTSKTHIRYDGHRIYVNGEHVHFTTKETRYLVAIGQRSCSVSTDALMTALYYDSVKDEPQDNILRVFKLKIEKKLAEHGPVFTSYSKVGVTLNRDLYTFSYEPLKATLAVALNEPEYERVIDLALMGQISVDEVMAKIVRYGLQRIKQEIY